MASFIGSSIGLFFCRHWLCLRALISSALGSFVDGCEISGGGFDVGSGGVFSHFWRLLHWLGFIIVAGDISGLWRRHWLWCGINVMIYLRWRR